MTTTIILCGLLVILFLYGIVVNSINYIGLAAIGSVILVALLMDDTTSTVTQQSAIIQPVIEPVVQPVIEPVVQPDIEPVVQSVIETEQVTIPKTKKPLSRHKRDKIIKGIIKKAKSELTDIKNSDMVATEAAIMHVDRSDATDLLLKETKTRMKDQASLTLNPVGLKQPLAVGALAMLVAAGMPQTSAASNSLSANIPTSQCLANHTRIPDARYAPSVTGSVKFIEPKQPSLLDSLIEPQFINMNLG